MGMITISDDDDNTPDEINITISQNASLQISIDILEPLNSKIYIPIFGAQIKYK